MTIEERLARFPDMNDLLLYWLSRAPYVFALGGFAAVLGAFGAWQFLEASRDQEGKPASWATLLGYSLFLASSLWFGITLFAAWFALSYIGDGMRIAFVTGGTFLAALNHGLQCRGLTRLLQSKDAPFSAKWFVALAVSGTILGTVMAYLSNHTSL